MWEREGSGSVRARNTLKWRQAECAERERAIDTSSSEAPRPCQLTAEFSPPAGSGWGGGDRPPPSRFALPSTLPTPRPSPPLDALCKSPHMLPRVPVSQRHSRASFYTHRNVVTDWRKGTIKRVLSLSPLLITRIRTTYTDFVVTHRYTGREDGVYVRVRARRSSFQCFARSPITISVAQQPPREGRRAVDRGSDRTRERERRKGAIHHRFYPIPTCIGNLFFFYFYIDVHRAILWNLVSSEALTLPRPRLICYFLPSFLPSRASVEWKRKEFRSQGPLQCGG